MFPVKKKNSNKTLPLNSISVSIYCVFLLLTAQHLFTLH